MNKPYSCLFESRPSHRLLCIAAAGVLALAGNGARADSLWSSSTTAISMVSDKRAISVGDILNILVQENSTASKDTSTKTSKKTGLDAALTSFLFSPQASGLLTKKGQMPAFKFNYAHDFDGSGQVNATEKIIARIAVTVMDVLPNGNLIVEGTRQTSFAGESQDVVLRGVVRPADVTANNTVYSYNVANATIKLISKGAASDASKKGWLTKIWDKVSPF
jgi:flagellar L-ring protein precursor FlgH